MTEQAHDDDEGYPAQQTKSDLAERREVVRWPEVILAHGQKNMQEPDEVEALFIPTPLDVAMSISRRFADEAATGRLSDDLSEGLAQALAGEQCSDIGLLLLITYARGCHEATEVYRRNGNDSLAGLMLAMGQDLLGKAMDTYGELVAIGIAASGTTRH